GAPTARLQVHTSSPQRRRRPTRKHWSPTRRIDHGACARSEGWRRLRLCQALHTMIETSARLLALLSLLQLRREWTGRELADRLDVGARTIRRDVEKLRSLGYPIEAAPGVAGGYRLGAGGELPPLLLDDAEAVAVAVGLRTAAAG